MTLKKINGRSQYNEDAIIEKIFKNLKISKGVFFEIGVNDMTLDRSIQCNSINLLNKGWKGKLVDANFKHPLVLNEFISIENINEIAKLAGNKIDFFSIDIDSYDWHVIREVLSNKIIDINVFCVETNNYNGHCFLDRVLKLDAPAPNTKGNPKSDSFGATTFAYNLLMVKYGYRLIATSDYGVNAFFVKEKFANLFPKAGKMRELYIDSNNLFTNWNKKGPSENMTMAQKLINKL
jgi:hypothetical protein